MGSDMFSVTDWLLFFIGLILFIMLIVQLATVNRG